MLRLGEDTADHQEQKLLDEQLAESAGYIEIADDEEDHSCGLNTDEEEEPHNTLLDENGMSEVGWADLWIQRFEDDEVDDG
jgi:hypothetical protein